MYFSIGTDHQSMQSRCHVTRQRCSVAPAPILSGKAPSLSSPKLEEIYYYNNNNYYYYYYYYLRLAIGKRRFVESEKNFHGESFFADLVVELLAKPVRYQTQDPRTIRLVLNSTSQSVNDIYTKSMEMLSHFSDFIRNNLSRGSIDFSPLKSFQRSVRALDLSGFCTALLTVAIVHAQF